MTSQVCSVCGAPRTTSAAACPFCKTLFDGAAPPPPADPRVPAELIAELDRGNLIAAIKVHRQVFKSSLREAKQAVEALVASRKR